MSDDVKVAVVSGANRGIGLEVTRQLAEQGWLVIALGRNLHKIGAAVMQLQQQGLRVEPRHVDITRQQDCEALAKWLDEKDLKVDVLINNAGVFRDHEMDGPFDVLNLDAGVIMETLNTNTLGALRLIQALVPKMKSPSRVINVSSTLGQLSTMGNGHLAYRLSKTGLNSITRIMSARLAELQISVNSVCPGWVKTDMGGPRAEREVEQGADTIVWMACSNEMKHNGIFYRDREVIDW